jgi:hypothetical protein
MFDQLTPVGVSTDHQLPGCVLTVAKRDEVGEIDSSVALNLTQIAERAPSVARRLVVDGSRVTFCDTTVAHFIGRASDAMQVVVRRPSPLLADLLAATGLYHQILVLGEVSQP